MSGDTMPAGLCGPDDPPVFTEANPEGRAPVLLVADHAGRAVPASLGRLGLAEAAFDLHIAYDIGIAALTRRLAVLLDAPALLHGYSRLVIDPNRRLDDATSICTVSDGVAVPRNQVLEPGEAAARAEAFFRPYHAAIEGAVDRVLARGVVPAILSLHSFTPRMAGGVQRPWHVGLLWNEDGRIARPLMDRLAADPALTIGDNEPYSGRDGHGYTMPVHAERRGLPHVLIEVRQDLIAAVPEAEDWAGRLAAALQPILADPRLYRVA